MSFTFSVRSMTPILFILLMPFIQGCRRDLNAESLEKTSIHVPSDTSSPPSKAAGNIIKVRYFFSESYRCASCRKIEAYTKKAVLENFSEEIKSGKLEFSLVDVEKEENQPLVKKYKLFTKSVVLSEYEGESETRWRNLEKVWTLLTNERDFEAYIVKEVKSFLNP